MMGDDMVGERRWSRRVMATIAVVIAASVVVSCSSADTGGSEDTAAVTVVATTPIWGDVLRNVAGPDATVEVLIPTGADPHGYQPSSRDAAALQTADLIVANGLGLEEGLVDVIEAAEADGARLLEVAPLVDPLPFGEADASARGLDPHVWMDPERVADAADRIAEALSSIDDTIDWQRRADAYRQQLVTTDDEIVSILSVVPTTGRTMVTNHDAFGYFADRYGFEIVGVVIPGGSTLSEPSSADLAELVAQLRLSGIRVIFADTTSPSVLAEAVAAELGEDVTVVDLYSGTLGEPGTGADTLTGMLVANARTVAGALAP